MSLRLLGLFSGQLILLTGGDVLYKIILPISRKQPPHFTTHPNFTDVGKSGCIEAYFMSCMGLICDSLGNIVCLKGTCSEINNLREETNVIGGRITYCGIFFFHWGQCLEIIKILLILVSNCFVAT